MISKGYHYVINLGIISNFCISIDPFYHGSCARGFIVVSELRGIWVFPFQQILEPIIHDEFWQGIITTLSIKSLCFISTIPVHFIHSTIKFSNYYFVFISITFIFHIILLSFKEIPTSQLILVFIPWRHIRTENTVIGRSNFKGHKRQPQRQLQRQPSGQERSKTSNPFVWLSAWGKKRWSPSNMNILCDAFGHSWFEFQLKYYSPCFGFCKI